jgi:two-component system CheB/CheR fusion protein
VIFGHHDLVQDAPISRIDLLVSRNALMYFTAEAQARILERFNFALKETGFLFLGKSEMLITHTSLFRPYDLKRRVFRKVPGTRLRESLAQLGPALVPGDLASGITRTGELRTEAGQLAPTAQIVVDRGGFLVEANQRARQLFDIAPADLGRPFHELELSYRPVDLRSGLDELYKSEREVALGRVEWRVDGDARVLEVKLTPVPLSGGQALGCSITFEDVTELARLNEAYEQRKRELERAYEELQSTVEELETTNEELMSTNEELETTNEELQSTNEELETMNEELQSTNDELETMNQEHVDRSRELDQINIFFEGILASLGVGVIVIGRDRKIQVWNAESGEFWGLRPEEAIGARLEDLDIGLPVDKLDAPISDALAGDGRAGFLSLEAVNRRGRPFHADVRVMPLLEESGASHGALIIVEDRGESRSPVRT